MESFTFYYTMNFFSIEKMNIKEFRYILNKKKMKRKKHDY